MKTWTGFFTLALKESKRVVRIWRQTLLPPVITNMLYFVIFGTIMGSRIGDVAGVNYITFVAPGLIMMNVILSSYNNAASSFFLSKFTHCIEEIFVSTLTTHNIIWGYLVGSIVRGVLSSLLALFVALFFMETNMYSWTLMILSSVLTAVLFGLAGIINAIFAKSFDGIAIAPNFILTPLIYLGGVFFSISFLPEFWQNVSKANPIFYIINMLRFSFLGIAEAEFAYGFAMVLVLVVALYSYCYYLIKNGVGLKS